MHARASVDVSHAGRAVVLVHGLVVSGRYMVPTAERLARDYRVFAPDLPGFGRSQNPPRVLDVAGLSDALSAWMGAMGLGRAALVGNSMGCQVVADLAVRHPDRVARVVLQGPTMDPSGRSVPRQVGRFLIDATREPPSLLPIELLDFLRAGPLRAWRTFRYALDDPIEERLPRVRVPALVVHGARDPIAPRRWAGEAAGLLPMGRLSVIPGAAHATNYGWADEFARVIREFLEEDTPPPSGGGR